MELKHKSMKLNIHSKNGAPIKNISKIFKTKIENACCIIYAHNPLLCIYFSI